MQEVLNDLFYGNINPNAKQFARNSEYGKAVKTVSDCEEKLLAPTATATRAEVSTMLRRYVELVIDCTT